MINGKRRLNLQTAIQEAGRCLLCYDAPCNTGCGSAIDPAGFILKLRMGDIKGAVRTMRRNNILAGVCAEVCPTCRLCVAGCSRSEIDEPIKISEIQAFLADYERREGVEVLKAPPKNGKKIAVIGSGPAGLSGAANLVMEGFEVVVFEKMPEPGGILRYGIPEHRLPSEILDHEINLIKKLGVIFECNKSFQNKEELESLLKVGFDAIFLATGCDLSYSLGLPGNDSDGIFGWDKFLRISKETPNKLTPTIKGKRVVVVGGGSVAMDCAVTAKQFGAARVYALSLESMEELPADVEEKFQAFREGIRFRPNCRVTEIIGENGQIKSIKGIEIKWISPGKFVPNNAEDIPGTEFSLPTDILIEAIGAGFSEGNKTLIQGIETEKGRVKSDFISMATSNPKIFAGGDMTAVGKTVSSSIMDGKKAAKAIAETFLSEKSVQRTKTSRPSLEIEFCGIKFKNPFCLSSSPVGNTAR